MLIALAIATLSLPSFAETAEAQVAHKKIYTPDVVEKADAILAGVGLRRSGKLIQSTKTTEISRAISSLTRERRELRLVYQGWKTVADRLAAIRIEMEQLNAGEGALSLQLVRVAGVDVAANNRIVGLINASRAKTRALIAERERLKVELTKKRATLSRAEAEYAETVLAMRQDYTAVHEQLVRSLADDKVQISLRVMQVNYATPSALNASKILLPVDKRIERIEDGIFSESIVLDVETDGSLYVNVVIGRKSMRMVVDSGATMLSLPAKSAAALGVEIPLDAPQLKVRMADGREIPGRKVILPKVRVGKFEAENVEAAIIDAVAVGAEPLLGMSFLGNFKFEVDAAEKSLKLLRVAAE